MTKLSQNNMLLVGGLLLVVLAVVAFVLYKRRKKSESFAMEKTGEYMVGVHGSKSNPVDYRLEHQVHPSLDEYQKEGNRNVHITPDKLGELGVQRDLGYGEKYHIMGGKAFACNNDPSHLTTVSCELDDYSLWQTGDMKDFDHNPIYGYKVDGMSTHSSDQNPYNYNESGLCRCTSNVNPRQSFDTKDPITKAPTSLNKAKFYKGN